MQYDMENAVLGKYKVSLIGVTSNRVLEQIGKRLGLSPKKVCKELNDYLHTVIRYGSMIQLVPGQSSVAIFTPLIEDNVDWDNSGCTVGDIQTFPISTDAELVKDFHDRYPEVVPPVVKSMAELLNYAIPDNVTFH